MMHDTPSPAPLAGDWLIVGPGALGRLLATRLADHQVIVLIGRHTRHRPLSLTTPEGKTLIRDVRRITAKSAPGQPAAVLLTTKAYATETALCDIGEAIAPTTPLVLWQNGYRVQEPITRRWPGPVLCASTTEGAYTHGDDGVIHAGHGETHIGHLDGKYRALADDVACALSTAGLPARGCHDIRQRLWHKLAVNAAINPLVARFRIRNGQLRDRPFRPMVEAVIAEVTAIMTLEGIAPPAIGWSALIWKVIADTANNRASMLQDVLAGRPTERDAILGPLLDAAARHHLDAPALASLWEATPP